MRSGTLPIYTGAWTLWRAHLRSRASGAAGEGRGNRGLRPCFRVAAFVYDISMPAKVEAGPWMYDVSRAYTSLVWPGMATG